MSRQGVVVTATLCADARECGGVDVDAFQFSSTVVVLLVNFDPARPKIASPIPVSTYPLGL